MLLASHTHCAPHQHNSRRVLIISAAAGRKQQQKPRRRAAAAAPADCKTVGALAALAQAESRRQGPGWHAAALSQLSRLAGSDGAARRAVGELALSLSFGLQKALQATSATTTSSGSNGGARAAAELGSATAALAAATQLAAEARPVLQAALRQLQAAVLDNSSSSSSSSIWDGTSLAAVARGLAAAREAGESVPAAAAEAVAAECGRLCAGFSETQGAPSAVVSGL
jgi:hypothetical protein